MLQRGRKALEKRDRALRGSYSIGTSRLFDLRDGLPDAFDGGAGSAPAKGTLSKA